MRGASILTFRRIPRCCASMTPARSWRPSRRRILRGKAMRRKAFLWLLAALLPMAAAAKTNGDMLPAPVDAPAAITKENRWLNTSRPLTAYDLRGRIILLDFWTYCCVNCLHVMPELAKLEEKFGNKLVVIGVHSAKFTNEADTDNIRQAIIRYGVRHAVVNDADFTIWKAFGIKAWPSLVLLNNAGKVAARYSGEGHGEEIAKDIEALLKESSGKPRTDALPMMLEETKLPPSLLRFPSKLAAGVTPQGDPLVFIADSGQHRIVAVGPGGEVKLVIGSGTRGRKNGSFENAQFDGPQGMVYQQGALYIADSGNHLLRRADLQTRMVTTLAGDGTQARLAPSGAPPALKTPLSTPMDLALWPDNQHIAIAMTGLHQLWSYNIENKTVKVLAGTTEEGLRDGAAAGAALAQPSGLAASGDTLYFVDAESSALRLLKNGQVKTLVGKGLFEFGHVNGGREAARLQHPLGLAVDGGRIYVADAYNHTIRRYENGRLDDAAGTGKQGAADGEAAKASFNEPGALLKVKDKLYIADSNNYALRTLSLSDGKVETLPVREAARKVDASYSETLPNTMEMEPVKLAEKTMVKITLQLPRGWHINQDAPSYLALFDMYRGKGAVVTFDRGMIQQGRLLLPPRVGRMYQLQGSLYYCQSDAKDSQCLLTSVDVPVSFVAEDGDRELKISVK
ncbi:MAG: hypothetical protein EBX37_08580 [Alphaproteobacteria bacterium]|nr:hypothetical protein [Alphaproteobacteria bacterium]